MPPQISDLYSFILLSGRPRVVVVVQLRGGLPALPAVAEGAQVTLRPHLAWTFAVFLCIHHQYYLRVLRWKMNGCVHCVHRSSGAKNVHVLILQLKLFLNMNEAVKDSSR